MPTPDQTRLAEDRARPRAMELWWALRPLLSVVRFMNTGAHPDDEITAMLAAIGLRDGINLSYACSTRGEGGQNDIGTEMTEDLGALRTREMERACDVLGMRMYWLSEHPEDSIFDFGFSKSGTETLAKWGRARTLQRFVEIIRTEKPDIICPTFLNVPGQHGHHRAMTELAHEVMAAAADPAFASNLAPWQVKKMYLPAWSGAGQAYDDDLPPPEATLVVSGDGCDRASGWSWARIGQQSRAHHRTQAMGRWVPAGPTKDYPLHLVESHVAGPDVSLASGMAMTLADLGEGAPEIADTLRAAGAAIDAAVAAWPVYETVAARAAEALGHVRAAMDGCSEAAADEVLHRLAAKEVQLAHVLRLAAGVEVRGRTDRVWLAPGERCDVTVEAWPGAAEALSARVVTPAGMTAEDGSLVLGPDAPLTDPYRACYDPAFADLPALEVTFTAQGAEATCRLPFEVPPVILPARAATLAPEKAVLNRASGGRTVAVAVSDLRPEGAAVAFDLPAGWTVTESDGRWEITASKSAAEGRHDIPVTLDGAPAQTVRRIAHDHIAPTARAWPAALSVRVLTAEVPAVRVGYIGGGNDRVGHWLAAMGADVTDVMDAELASDSALSRYDSLVIGIFAVRFRAGLAEAMPRLHRWVENGGTLVTLYHRPWDNWDPDTIPPKRLEIGQPSLRWRVTDEAAEVTHLVPDHPLLTTPNMIGPEDWAGWHKERGLYFAKSWDAAYVPLLSMADQDEAPHEGALLAADIGKGRHVHTSLILHHQMEKLVPGAFRLMANLIARRG